MGYIRIILAAAVLLDHLGISSVVKIIKFDTTTAVQSFFVISGFYMSLILNEKYIEKSKSYFLFMSNRILRLYPIYWIVLLIASIIFIPHLLPMSILNFALLMGKQIFIFVDPKYFISPGNGSFIFIPPAWTLGIEMLFYIIAPFFVKSKKKLALLFGISLVLKLFFNYSAISENLIFFTLGALSYQIYNLIKTKNFHHLLIIKILSVLFFLFVFIPAIAFIKNNNINYLIQNLYSIIYFPLFTLSIPIMFLTFSKSRIDRLIGDFSYPLYICHSVVLHIFYRLYLINNLLYIIAGAITVIIFAQLLITFVDKPIQAFRASRIPSNKKLQR